MLNGFVDAILFQQQVDQAGLHVQIERGDLGQPAQEPNGLGGVAAQVVELDDQQVFGDRVVHFAVLQQEIADGDVQRQVGGGQVEGIESLFHSRLYQVARSQIANARQAFDHSAAVRLDQHFGKRQGAGSGRKGGKLGAGAG